MKTKTQLIASLVLVLAACGDNKLAPDARERPDTGSGSGNNFPAAPTLGTQIDRMGRPAINTLLNRGFEPPSAAVGSAKDAYNANSMPATWLGFVMEFSKNLAILDSLDTGFCGNGRCEGNEIPGATNTGGMCMADCGAVGVGSGSQSACGNQALYNGMPQGGGSAMATSYQTLAAVLANDQLHLDTSKTMCAVYLAVEFSYTLAGMDGTNATCGGRAPNYDVVDFSLSMTSMGVAGLTFLSTTNVVPKLKDNAPPHTDFLGPDAFETPQEFPFLGPPQP